MFIPVQLNEGLQVNDHHISITAFMNKDSTRLELPEIEKDV